jgi:hypothetical protein
METGMIGRAFFSAMPTPENWLYANRREVIVGNSHERRENEKGTVG